PFSPITCAATSINFARVRSRLSPLGTRRDDIAICSGIDTPSEKIRSCILYINALYYIWTGHTSIPSFIGTLATTRKDRMLTTFLLGFVGLIALVFIGALTYRALRQRRTSQILAIRTQSGIAEGRFVPINGTEQWVHI